MEVDDIIIDPATCDVVISGGDLLVGKSDQQHVEHILRADRGHFRQWPLLGVGLEKNLKGPISPQELKQAIKLQLKSDNYNVREVQVSRDAKNINIDAQRIR